VTNELIVTYLEALPGHEEALRERLVSLQAPDIHVFGRIHHLEQFVVLDFTGAAKDMDIPDLLAAAPDQRHHEALTSFGDVPTDQSSVVLATHVDIVPAHKEEGTAIVVEHVETSKAHPGCLAMAVYAQTDRPNHMTLLEGWQSIDALQNHRADPNTIEFRSKVLPLSGSLYDERLYSRFPI